MNNDNWVCFDCRAAARSEVSSEPIEVACPKCGNLMTHIGDTRIAKAAEIALIIAQKTSHSRTNKIVPSR